MFFSGLKLQIAGTLAVLLTLAILLSYLVVIAFWQKGVVRSEIEHVRSVLGVVLSENDSEKANQLSHDELKALCRATGSRCVGVVLSGGEHWLKSDIPEIRAKCLQLAQESPASHSEVIRIEGRKHLLVADPLPSDDNGEPRSAVVVVALDSIYENIVENHQTIFVYLLVNLVILNVVGFFRLITITVKPIERIVRMSKTYQDPATLFFNEEQGRTEFGQLSMALNSMLYRIESDRVKLRQTVASLETANAELFKTQKEMIRTEKIASVGRLSAGLAHEIGNPIGIVQGYVELLQQPDLDQTDKQQFAQRALDELARVNRLIRQLLDYAGSSSQEMSIFNLDQLFEEICQIVSFKKFHPPISVLRCIPSDIFIEFDGESLRQVFLNCLLNALDAIESKTGEFERKVVITAEKIVESESLQTNVHIQMEDNGIGIEEKNLQVIFDPFFTTKDQGKGTGLGLFVSHSIIDAHGGRIWIESTVGKGSSVNIILPLYAGDCHGT